MSNIKVHQVYDLYEFNAETGQYRMVGKNDWLNGSSIPSQKYRTISIRGKETKQKVCLLHRAMWEIFNGEIPEGNEIDHIDNDPNNNKLSNLQCISMSENRKRRNHDFLRNIGKDAYKNNNDKQNIKGTNIETSETQIFSSKTQASKYYGCSPAMVYCICEGKSKIFGGNIKFEYTHEEPTTTLIGKRGRKALSEEEKKESHKKAMEKYRNKKKLESSI